MKDENKKYVEYFIVLSIIFTYLIPQIISIGSNYSDSFEILSKIIDNKLQIKYVGGYTTYFIIGWYVHNYDIKNKKLCIMLGVSGLIISILGTYILSVSTGKDIPMYSNLSLNVLFQSVMVFLLIKTAFINKEGCENKLINAVSKNSLGIYAVHILAITAMEIILSKIGLKIAIVYIPIVFVFSFIVSFLTTSLLGKIPFLKKFV